MSRLITRFRSRGRRVKQDAKNRTPNAETRKAIRDVSEDRDITRYKSFEDFRKSLLDE